jgi:DNA polymerase III subunit beta
MDLTIDQPRLSRALRLAGRVVPTRPTQPVLGAVLLEAAAGHLTLVATDGDLGVVTTLAADVTTAGRAALPARLLSDYIAQLPAEPARLHLETTSRQAWVRCGRSAANLATIDPTGLPISSRGEDGDRIDVDPGHLLNAVTRVESAAARDSSRPVLATVCFDVHAGELTLAATDGFRLARAQAGSVESPDRQLLVPAPVVIEFGRLLPDAQTARVVRTSDSRGVQLIADHTSLSTRLVEGRFPDLERVIPTEWRTRVRLATAGLRQALRLVSPFGAGGDARPVVLDAAPNCLRLRARGNEIDEAESELVAITEGEPQSVALNARLLTDMLEAARDREIELAWTSPEAPVVLREPGRRVSGDLWLVMPLYDAALVHHRAEAA